MNSPGHPVYAGILIGGRSSRMGRPKHLIESGGRTWVEMIAGAVRPFVDTTVLLGAGDLPASLRSLPCLPDNDAGAGPIRAMRTAVRWNRRADWIFIGCDQPDLTPAAVAWLLDRRRRPEGVVAVLPRLSDAGRPEPLPAFYGAQAAPLLEQIRRPRDLAHFAGVVQPVVPPELVSAWRNRNTPADLP